MENTTVVLLSLEAGYVIGFIRKEDTGRYCIISIEKKDRAYNIKMNKI